MQNFEKYPEAENRWICDVTKENIGDYIKTVGLITSADNINPVIIKKVYICKTCQRLHKITENDSLDEVLEKCIKCNGSMDPVDYGYYDDTQLLTLQDIFDSNRTEIYASTLGDDAYYGKYRVGDYVNIIARVDTMKLKRRNRLILKIEEIRLKSMDEKIAKKALKSKRLTEAQIARSTKE